MCTTLPCDKEVLRDLLWLINFNECQLAVGIWSNFRKHVMKSCNGCPGANSRTDLICGQCLERTLKRFEAFAPDDTETEHERLLAMRNLQQRYRAAS